MGGLPLKWQVFAAEAPVYWSKYTIIVPNTLIVTYSYVFQSVFNEQKSYRRAAGHANIIYRQSPVKSPDIKTLK